MSIPCVEGGSASPFSDAWFVQSFALHGHSCWASKDGWPCKNSAGNSVQLHLQLVLVDPQSKRGAVDEMLVKQQFAVQLSVHAVGVVVD